MNLFPNLQIHIYADREHHHNNMRPSRSQPATTLLSLIQSFLRNRDASSNDFDDIQVVFGVEPSGSGGVQQTGLLIEEMNQRTNLFICKDLDQQECSICRNPFNEDDICRKINSCGHYFHQHCVDSWLVRNHTCPMCRNDIVQSSSP